MFLWERLLQKTKEEDRTIQEATLGLAKAKEISGDAAVEAVLSEPDDIKRPNNGTERFFFFFLVNMFSFD